MKLTLKIWRQKNAEMFAVRGCRCALRVAPGGKDVHGLPPCSSFKNLRNRFQIDQIWSRDFLQLIFRLRLPYYWLARIDLAAKQNVRKFLRCGAVDMLYELPRAVATLTVYRPAWVAKNFWTHLNGKLRAWIENLPNCLIRFRKSSFVIIISVDNCLSLMFQLPNFILLRNHLASAICKRSIFAIFKNSLKQHEIDPIWVYRPAPVNNAPLTKIVEIV